MLSTPRAIQIQVMSPHDFVGGGAMHARGLAQGLRKHGLRVSLLCTGSARPHKDRVYDEIIACQPHSWPLLWRHPPLGSMPFWLRAARRATARVDAVIALSPVLAMATRWVRPRLPVLYAPASLVGAEHADARRGAFKWFERRAFRAAHRILLTTPALRRAVETLYGPLHAPVGICPLGIDTEHARRVTRSRAEWGIPANARLLLSVGLLNENKGQRYVARALARCARSDWWWVILGSGTDEAAIRHELRDSAIESQTLLLDKERNPADWYAAADLLVASSRAETFGLAIAEALFAGLPVVIPQDALGDTLSPLAEAVEASRLGRTFRRGDAQALAATLTAALDDQRELAEMGRRAAAYAQANFSWERYARCTLRLFENPADITYEPVSPDEVEGRAHGEKSQRHGARGLPSSGEQTRVVANRG